jgi:hypothetical protein
MSTTNPSDKKFISGMQVGTSDTGGRRAGEKYPLIKYTLAGNAPGIYDMNTILPRHANEKFGKDGGYSSVVDGLLARGQTAKLTNITMDEKLGIPIYHVELGGKSRAKTGLFQNLINYEQKERFRTSTREDRTNPKVLSWLQERTGLRSTMPRYTGQSTQSSMNIGRMAPTPLLPGGSSSLPSYGWSGTNQKFAVGKAMGGVIGKGPKKSSDQGLDWFNSFIQNLLGGGNPSAAMQNDSTKALLSQSYIQGSKNMGVDPTDPMFYASMFGPSMGLKALGMAGKGQTKLSPLGKLNEMLYKNKVHGPTGLPMFIPKFKSGGMFRTPYADGGLAMLHDKEFVMNPGAVKEYGVDKLKAMNSGTYSGGSVYNSYGVNINVGNSNSNANDIARTVVREIKRLDSQNIRSTKV